MMKYYNSCHIQTLCEQCTLLENKSINTVDKKTVAKTNNQNIEINNETLIKV